MIARLVISAIAFAVGFIVVAPGRLDAEGGAPKAAARVPAKKTTETELKKLFPTKPLDNKEQARFAHAPFLQGECGMCHESDNRDKPGKLKAPTNALCMSCHEPTRREMQRHAFAHKPAKLDCGYCHNAHNAPYRYFLYDSPQALCNRCHTDVEGVVKNAKVKHDPTFKGLTCLNCHTSHASDVEHQLLALPSSICLKCHAKDDIVDAEGKKLINIGVLLKTNPVHHQPVDKKDCSACHAAHGSSHPRLLLRRYSLDFYASYTKENYALCYSCHTKEEAITQAKTATLTAFRDGDRNLHTVHVLAPERNRTCRTCHGEHATDQVHLIRKEVPYGNQGWNLTIAYRATPTGGLCTKSCHDIKEYKNK